MASTYEPLINSCFNESSKFLAANIRPVSQAVTGCILAALVIVLTGCASSPPIPSELRTTSESTDCSRDQCLDFIYLHGTQRHSDEAQEGFYEYVDPLHDWIMAELYQRPEVHEGLLKEDQRRINPVPVKFYWGDMSIEALDRAKDLMAWSSAQHGEPGFFSKLAQKNFVLGTHDTYWISEEANKRRVNIALHKTISASLKQDHQTVLFGHSAGAIVVQAYAMYHWPYIDLAEIAADSSDPTIRSLLQGNSNRTCIQAMLEAGLVDFRHTGDLEFRLEQDTSSDMAKLLSFRQSFLAEKIEVLPEYTRRFCTPAGSVKGIITYGHPGLILHGTLSSKERGIFLRSLRYIFENDLFWINIVHLNDPVGYALLDSEDVPERVARKLGEPVLRQGGFIVNGSEESGASVFTAHSWYWMKPKEFAGVLAETYAKGYKNALDMQRK